MKTSYELIVCWPLCSCWDRQFEPIQPRWPIGRLKATCRPLPSVGAARPERLLQASFARKLAGRSDSVSTLPVRPRKFGTGRKWFYQIAQFQCVGGGGLLSVSNFNTGDPNVAISWDQTSSNTGRAILSCNTAPTAQRLPRLARNSASGE